MVLWVQLSCCLCESNDSLIESSHLSREAQSPNLNSSSFLRSKRILSSLKEGTDEVERERELSLCLACFPILHLHLPLQTDFLLHLILFSLSNALITPSEYYRSVLATTPYARSFSSWIILVYNVATISVGAIATATLEKVREKESRLIREPYPKRESSRD